MERSAIEEWMVLFEVVRGNFWKYLCNIEWNEKIINRIAWNTAGFLYRLGYSEAEIYWFMDGTAFLTGYACQAPIFRSMRNESLGVHSLSAWGCRCGGVGGAERSEA